MKGFALPCPVSQRGVQTLPFRSCYSRLLCCCFQLLMPLGWGDLSCRQNLRHHCPPRAGPPAGPPTPSQLWTQLTRDCRQSSPDRTGPALRLIPCGSPCDCGWPWPQARTQQVIRSPAVLRGADPAPWDSPSRADPDPHVSDRNAFSAVKRRPEALVGACFWTRT